MITVTTTVFKKTTLAFIGLACAAGIVLSVGLSHQSDTEVQAATTETKRVWINDSNAPSWWWGNEASTGLHFWGTGFDFFVKPVLDEANSTKYYDVRSDASSFQILRILPDDSKYNYSSNLTYSYNTFWVNSDASIGTSAAPTNKTTVVSNYEASWPSDYSICSATVVKKLVDDYNALSTFEQDQFDALTLNLPDGQGTVNARTRLIQLQERFYPGTPLNASNIGASADSSVFSMMTMLIIGAVGLTALGGYYVISRKKHLA